MAPQNPSHAILARIAPNTNTGRDPPQVDDAKTTEWDKIQGMR